ncbi:MAG TPA: enoyl-CoA hydratase/isomerase family protein [Acidimicrobiales bacterium]
MDDDPVLLEMKGSVATVSLNRPDRHNATDDATDALLFRYLDLLRTDPDVRVVVLRGNGPSFSAGRDLAEVDERPVGVSDIELIERRQWGTRLLYDFPVPIVCALKGWVLGTGFERALLCDLRVASDSAKMALSAIHHGHVGDAAGIAQLHEIGGSALALDMALTGRLISSHDALRLHLVSWVVADEDLDDVVRDLAEKIAARPPLVVRLLREHVHSLAAPDVASTLRRELVSQAMVVSSRDHAEFRASRVENREPRYEKR